MGLLGSRWFWRIRVQLERSTRDDVNICVLWMLCYRSTDVSRVCVSADAVIIYGRRFRVPCIWASYGALGMKILFVGVYWVGMGKG